MLRLPAGLSFDFLGTVARFYKPVGHVYKDFSRYLSPTPGRSTPSTENMAELIRAVPAVDLDVSFRSAFRSAAQACFTKEGLHLPIPHEDRSITITVPGGITHEETEEFWLQVVRDVYVRALLKQKGLADEAELATKDPKMFEVVMQIREGECFVEDLFYPLYDHLGSSLVYECPRRVLDCLQWLKSLRCATDGHQMRFVLVSNYDIRVHNIVRGLNLVPEYFDEVISTHESKCLKPDPTPIRMAMQREYEDRKAWVHVGDTDADAGAAAEAPCLFCPVTADVAALQHLSDDELLADELAQREEGLVSLPAMKRFMFRHYANPDHHTVRLAASDTMPVAALSSGDEEKKN